MQIEISDTLNDRLRKHVTDFGDTHESTINRLLDICETHQRVVFKSPERSRPQPRASAASTTTHRTDEKSVIIFSPDDPPRFTYSRLIGVILDDKEIENITWNGLIAHFAIMAHNHITMIDDLKHYIQTSYEIGKVDGRGFRFIREAGISLRGVESNLAYQTIRHSARKFNLRMELVFRWQDKNRAQHPGRVGRIIVEPVIEPVAHK